MITIQCKLLLQQHNKHTWRFLFTTRPHHGIMSSQLLICKKINKYKKCTWYMFCNNSCKFCFVKYLKQNKLFLATILTKWFQCLHLQMLKYFISIKITSLRSYACLYNVYVNEVIRLRSYASLHTCMQW